MSSDRIVFSDVSKFYGEVLGVNKVNLEVPPGLTGLVGPNGSGKSTLMHLMTGLLRPSRGEISVLGIAPDRPEELFRKVGYCTQYDSFPNGATGISFLLYGLSDFFVYKILFYYPMTKSRYQWYSQSFQDTNHLFPNF